MKKFTLFCAVALLVSFVNVGCSTSGSSWCRTGSLFPTSRTKEATQVVYTTSALSSNCVSDCNPCDQIGCAPCDPICNACDPVCDPCIPCRNVYSSGTIIPRPSN